MAAATATATGDINLDELAWHPTENRPLNEGEIIQRKIDKGVTEVSELDVVLYVFLSLL